MLNNRKIDFFSDLLGLLREFICMFLSSHENKIDRKGRVSVPASFRSYITNLGYNGFICYPSFNYSAIEACSQNRIEQIADSIDALNPFEEKRDVFATSGLPSPLSAAGSGRFTTGSFIMYFSERLVGYPPAVGRWLRPH